MSAPWDYKVLIDDLEPDAPCACSACEWSGVFDDLDEIRDCSLTPGDASPAGRCPDPNCGSLAYAVRPKDHAREHGVETLAALRALVAWGLEHTSPRDDNSPHQLLVDAQAAIARIEGREDNAVQQ